MKPVTLFCFLITYVAFSTALAAEWNAKDFKMPNNAILHQKLTAIQYEVTQHQGTEPAFDNAWWNNESPGLYVDIISGEPLFSSLDKYDSKTGWPSFTKPIHPGSVILRPDHSLPESRTEVISSLSHAHLGHVFDDGPAPAYKRYCMNSAAMLFIPVTDLKKRGYEKYVYLFNNISGAPVKGKYPQ